MTIGLPARTAVILAIDIAGKRYARGTLGRDPLPTTRPADQPSKGHRVSFHRAATHDQSLPFDGLAWLARSYEAA